MEETHNVMIIYQREAIFYISFIIFCEVYQFQNKQETEKTMFDIFYLIYFYFTGYSAPNKFIHFLTKLTIFVFVIFETISWKVTHRGICPQVTLSILDYRYIIIVKPIFLLYGFLAFVVAILICSIPGHFFKGPKIRLRRYFLIRIVFFSILCYFFFFEIATRLVPYRSGSFTMPDNQKIIQFFQKSQIQVASPIKPKNLIMIHIECAEQRSLGIFNRKFPSSMPFLASLAKNGTILTNVTMLPEQGFTLSSVFTQRSSLPMLGFTPNDRGSLFMSPRVHTIMDFLDKLGYSQMASCSGFCSTYKFYSLHHMRIIDKMSHKQMNDYGHFEYLSKTLLPQLKNESEKSGKPFFLVVHNEDTHPKFVIEKECLDVLPDEVKKKWPEALISLQCYDMSLKKVINKVVELGLDKNSLVFIYGDHLLWGNTWYYENPRKMLMLFPFMEKKIVSKPVSLFDESVTIMRLLGIENYSPEFPFGFDFFSDNVTVFPTLKDRQYMNNIAHSFIY